MRLLEINLRDLFCLSRDKLPDWVDYEYCIYKITNLKNNKSYIGQAKWFYGRFIANGILSHKVEFINHCKFGSNRLIYKAIKKYGSRNFKVTIIDEASMTDELNQLESKWIGIHESYFKLNRGYNMTLGGEDCSQIHSEESYNTNRLNHGGLLAWNLPETYSIAKKNSYESRLKLGNGDCMYMCRTPEANLHRIESDKRNHGGVMAYNLEDSVEKNVIGRLISNIFKRLDSIREDGNILNPYFYYYAFDQETKLIQSHIDRVCDKLYENPSIKDHELWNSDLEKLFNWFDQFDNWTDILNNLKIDMEY